MPLWQPTWNCAPCPGSARCPHTRSRCPHRPASQPRKDSRLLQSLDIQTLGEDVWRADPIAETHGFLALGTPIGSPAYAQAQLNLHLAAQQILLDELPQLADLQASWLLLTYCAAPRAQHILRTVPPTLAGEYAARHDAAVVATLSALLVPARSSRSRRRAGRGRVHGWQHAASLVVLTSYREDRVLPHLPPNQQPLLHSQSGPGAGGLPPSRPTPASLCIRLP
jgi:hypothetical protein